MIDKRYNSVVVNGRHLKATRLDEITRKSVGTEHPVRDRSGRPQGRLTGWPVGRKENQESGVLEPRKGVFPGRGRKMLLSSVRGDQRLDIGFGSKGRGREVTVRSVERHQKEQEEWALLQEDVQSPGY